MVFALFLSLSAPVAEGKPVGPWIERCAQWLRILPEQSDSLNPYRADDESNDESQFVARLSDDELFTLLFREKNRFSVSSDGRVTGQSIFGQTLISRFEDEWIVRVKPLVSAKSFRMTVRRALGIYRTFFGIRTGVEPTKNFSIPGLSFREQGQGDLCDGYGDCPAVAVLSVHRLVSDSDESFRYRLEEVIRHITGDTIENPKWPRNRPDSLREKILRRYFDFIEWSAPAGS